MKSTPHPLDHARRFLDLEMWQPAWTVIEALPLEERVRPEALRIRLLAATGKRWWTIAECTSTWLESYPELCNREAVGRFRAAFARQLCRGSNVAAVSAEVMKALAIWPEGRDTIFSDATLMRFAEGCALC